MFEILIIDCFFASFYRYFAYRNFKGIYLWYNYNIYSETDFMEHMTPRDVNFNKFFLNVSSYMQKK